MEEEIEDIVGDVQYTDSQKSVATSNVYSLDFTDSSSDKNNSSGKDTYVIEQCDSEDSDSYPIQEYNSVIHVKDAIKRDVDVQCIYEKTNRAAATSVQNCCIGQEIFTQTSKTIFELVNSEGIYRENIQTQTSLISITENRTVEYRIEFKNSIKNFEEDPKVSEINNSNYGLSNTVEDDSSRFPISDSETIKSDDNLSEISSDDRIIQIIDDESKENLLSEENNEEQYENISDFDRSSDSDIEEDSLMESRPRKSINENNSDTSEVPQSVDEDVEELYSKLSESIDLQIERPQDPRRFSTLTPLTEESTIKKESLVDITPYNSIAKSTDASDNEILFTNNAGVKIKMLPTDPDTFKLPPIQIQNRSCPNSPHLNFLFSVQTGNSINKSGTLPCVYEDNTGMVLDRWEIGNKFLASGESALINGRSDHSQGKDGVHLPPIHIEGYVVNSKINNNATQFSSEVTMNPCEDSISINEQIRELKLRNKSGKKPHSKYNIAPSERTRSPSSDGPDNSRLSDAAEKGCEVLCLELLKRLRSTSWCEVADTLEEIPRMLERFWGVIAEHRIADIIRQDFYEAVTLLLTKTSSYNRPVRRAANVALDEVVCGVEVSHAVTALCIHGIGHKSALVRCASGRLLVVCSALAGGGRGVLRARPPSAAAARAHALRALAALLDDKSTDARKYAERLYAMLRPLPNFEAYYLTDVDIETASRQMKKYDKLLLCGPTPTK